MRTGRLDLYSFIHSINVYGMPAVLCARSFCPTSLSHFPGLGISDSLLLCGSTVQFRLASDLSDLPISVSKAVGIMTVRQHV